MFNIRDYRAKLGAKGGVARPNRYWVVIESPSLSGNKQFLSYQCIAAQLPGRSFRTTEQMIYSSSRKFPYAVQYDDLSLTFLCSNSMDEKKTFDTWQRQIINPVNGILNYYDSYVGKIMIMTLDDEGNPSYVCYCEEAYPVTVQTVDLSYEDNDSLMRFTVQFAFRKWTSFEDQAIAGQAGIGLGPMPSVPEIARETFSIIDPTSGNNINISVPANLIGARDLFSSVTSLLPPNVFNFDFGSIPFLGDFMKNFTPSNIIRNIF
jgi:hypothetical protein